VKRQTNVHGAIPVCALCDSRSVAPAVPGNVIGNANGHVAAAGLIPLPDLINHAAGIESGWRCGTQAFFP